MLNARNAKLLQNLEIEKAEPIATESCDKIECPKLLNQIWVRQISHQQDASDRAYAKKHSLEIAFTPKFLSAKLADRSNKIDQVA